MAWSTFTPLCISTDLNKKNFHGRVRAKYWGDFNNNTWGCGNGAREQIRYPSLEKFGFTGECGYVTAARGDGELRGEFYFIGAIIMVHDWRLIEIILQRRRERMWWRERRYVVDCGPWEVMELELMRMDWTLPKGRKETSTDANGFAIFLGMLNVYLRLVSMNE